MTPAIPAASSTRRPLLVPAAILLLATFLLGMHLGVEPVGRSSERRCHEVARGMVESGDFLIPRIDGEPRLQKPPLYYWLAAASAKALGGVSLFSTRLPSAIGALLLLATVIAYAIRLGGTKIGFLAGILLVISFQFSTSGRRGDAEMWLAMSSACALFAFERYAADASLRSLTGFGAFLTLAFLAKATAAFVTVLAPVAVILALRSTRRRASVASTVLTVVIAITLGFSWYAWLIAYVPGAMRILLGDLLLPLGVRAAEISDAAHNEPIWYFARQFFSVAFPTCLLLPFVLLRVRTTRAYENDPALRSILIGASVQWIVFSLLPQKQKHYLLPLIPLYVILVADALFSARFSAASTIWLRRLIALSGVAASLASAVMLIGAMTFDPTAGSVTVVLLGGAILCGAVLFVRAKSGSWHEIAACLAVTTVFVLGDYHGRFEPWRESIDDLADAGAPLPDESRLRDSAQRHPQLAALLDIDEVLEDADEARQSLPFDPPGG